MSELKKIGFIIDNLSPSDFSLNLIYNLNVLASDLIHSVTVFVKNHRPAIMPALFSILHHVEAYSYEGILVSTNNESFNIMKKCWTAKNKFHYIWDFKYDDSFINNRNVYCDSSIKYITRSRDHFETLQNVWNTSSNIIEEFNYDKIRNMVKSC